MTPIMIAVAIAGVLAIVLLVGVVRMLMAREATIVDYPELPPPGPAKDGDESKSASA